MQNNVTELTQRLLRSLDSTYNVIDMPAVIEIVSLLEKVSVTKELLETTRLGKFVNELRRKTTNDSLSKRAKELVKKWRNTVLPDTNGQAATTPAPPPITINTEDSDLLKRKRPNTSTTPEYHNAKKFKSNGQLLINNITNNNELELLSDNSNSSFKDVINVNKEQQLTTPIVNKHLQQIQQQHFHQQRGGVGLDGGNEVILINSDSNSSIPEIKTEQQPKLEEQLPKKRGRKKGSKNHKNLLDEAESSFSNKLASVSRGNTKVKTTKELVAGLSKNNSFNNKFNQQKDDLSIRAAKLTERVSMIDKKLNTNANRYKSKNFLPKFTKINNNQDNKIVIESGSVINDKSLLLQHQRQKEEEAENEKDEDEDEDDEEIIIVDDKNDENLTENLKENKVSSLSVEQALAQLPPIDKTVLLLNDDEDNEPKCTCCLNEISCDNNKLLNLVDNSDENDKVIVDNNVEGLVQQPILQQQKIYDFLEDDDCLAKDYYSKKYYLNCDQLTLDKRVQELHDYYIPNVNGNYSLTDINNSDNISKNINDENGLYKNVVPNVNNECIPKNNYFQSENFQKYNISECNKDVADKNDQHRTENDDNNSESNIFREWHQVVDKPSYNGETLKILPYVIID